jgi:hypothetical protein
MQNPFRLFASFAVLAVTLSAVGAASAASLNQGPPPSNPGAGRPSHDEIVAYWTPDRVARARPRELVLPPPAVAPAPQARPDGVGGGGAGGPKSQGVTGASWTGGGLVKKTEGKVLFRMNGTDWTCSGTVVADTRPNTTESLVLTAGHCLYDSAYGFATYWMFMPDFDSAPSPYSSGTFNCAILPYGCWTAIALLTSTGWGNGNFNEDYGFAVMGGNGTSSLEATVGGSHPIAFSSTRPASVYAFGYPHFAPYDGTDLVYCSGATTADPSLPQAYGLKCDMTQGSSGGGWFDGFDKRTGMGTLVSVNSHRYNLGLWSSSMYGPLFDGETKTTYDQAQIATGNTIR